MFPFFRIMFPNLGKAFPFFRIVFPDFGKAFPFLGIMFPSFGKAFPFFRILLPDTFSKLAIVTQSYTENSQRCTEILGKSSANDV